MKNAVSVASITIVVAVILSTTIIIIIIIVIVVVMAAAIAATFTITIIIVIDQEFKEESTANFVAVLTITERAIGGFGSIVVVIIINTWEEKMLNSAGDGVIFGTQLLHHSG